MAVNAASFNRVVAIVALLFAVVLPMSHAAGLSLAPAPAPAPTSDECSTLRVKYAHFIPANFHILNHNEQFIEHCGSIT
ncbi:hypothetical protein ACLB2K_075248 [Fragaria x ananassa]